MTDSVHSPLTDSVLGLGADEIQRARERYGPNQMPPPPPPRLDQRLLRQLRDPLILLLLASAVVTVALHDLTDTIVIVLVIVLNTTVGVVQELRADHAVAALNRLAAPTARVVRNGRAATVPAADLVPGDVVRLSAGDIVPADVTIVHTARLRVDESALSGESVALDRAPRQPAMAGTTVVDGDATGVVTHTGASSALGRIATLVASQPRRRTPLQLRLAGLSRMLGVAAVALSGVVMLAGLLRGLSVEKMVLTAVSLTVAAVPESLPAVVTVALALGAYRMSRRRAIVRQLPAVETLGSVTLVAADKTGTLTEGRMSCREVVVPSGALTISGPGYEPHGDIHGVADPAAIRRLGRDMVLCNNAELAAPTGKRPDWQPVGDPMEAALLTAAARLGVPDDTRERHPRISEVPFQTERRRMSTVHTVPDGRYLLVCKGAPETVLTAEDRDSSTLRAAAADLARRGYRVLAVADAYADSPPDPDGDTTTLRPVGLVALTDPVRPGTRQLVDDFRDAGIRLVMITGDHPSTAKAVAEHIGLSPGLLSTGEQLAHRAGAPADADVFARTRPEQKMDLVTAWQQQGQAVAMTGDGVNDAPALRRADIGVAMGRGGTEAARQAADLILADDNLATVRSAVEEGRRIYANIRRFLQYGLAGGTAEVLIMVIGPFLGFTLPLLPAQILWINMLTHGLPGVALGAEPADRGALHRPPHRPGEAILGPTLGARIMLVAALITVTSLGAAWWAADTGRPWQSMLFLVLGLAQLGVAITVRAHPRPGTRRNWTLLIAVASSAVLQVAGVAAGPLRQLLGTTPVSVADVAACAGFAAAPALLLLLARLGARTVATSKGVRE